MRVETRDAVEAFEEDVLARLFRVAMDVVELATWLFVRLLVSFEHDWLDLGDALGFDRDFDDEGKDLLVERRSLEPILQRRGWFFVRGKEGGKSTESTQKKKKLWRES